MALSINTNAASMQAQNSLSNVNEALRQNQERLSTGLRINSAKDDAAGMSISTRMTAQVNGMNMAMRNANNGISMMQTAESNLEEVSNILQNMRELSVQASNSDTTASDRADMNQEYQDNLSELDRIAQSANYNGINLLDGSAGESVFQVGANTNANDKINVNFNSSMRISDIGATKEIGGNLELANGLTQDLAADDLIVESNDKEQKISPSNYAQSALTGTDAYGQGTDQTSEGKTASSAFALAAALNDNSELGVTATAANSTESVNTSLKASNTAEAGQVAEVEGTYNLSINGVNIYDQYNMQDSVSDSEESSTASIALTAEEVVGAINSKTDALGISATVNDEGKVKLDSADGGNIFINESIKGDFTTEGAGIFFNDLDSQAASSVSELSFTETDVSDIANNQEVYLKVNDTEYTTTWSDGDDLDDYVTALNENTNFNSVYKASADGDTLKIETLDNSTQEIEVNNFHYQVQDATTIEGSARVDGHSGQAEIQAFSGGDAPISGAVLGQVFVLEVEGETYVSEALSGGTSLTEIEAAFSGVSTEFSVVESGTNLEIQWSGKGEVDGLATLTGLTDLVSGGGPADSTEITTGSGAIHGFDLMDTDTFTSGLEVGQRFHIAESGQDGFVSGPLEEASIQGVVDAIKASDGYEDANFEVMVGTDDELNGDDAYLKIVYDDGTNPGGPTNMTQFDTVSNSTTDTATEDQEGIDPTQEVQSLSISADELAAGQTWELDVSGNTVTTDGLEAGTLQALADAVNNAVAEDDSIDTVTASVDDDGNFLLTWANEEAIDYKAELTQQTEAVPYGQAVADAGYEDEQIYRGDVSLESNEALTIKYTNSDDVASSSVFGGDLQAADGETASVNYQNPNSDAYLATTNVLSVDNAQNSIDRIDSAINDVNNFRATLGASQNRFESVVSNLANASQSLTEARGRIQDADIAKEAAEMTENNVKRQASSAILAQANQNPQLVLQLIGG